MPIRTRCHFIGIHTPQDDAQKRVTYCREAIIHDGDGIKAGLALDQPGDLTVPFAVLAPTVHTVIDARTGQQVEITGAMIAEWMGLDFDARQAAAAARIAAEKAAANQESTP